MKEIKEELSDPEVRMRRSCCLICSSEITSASIISYDDKCSRRRAKLSNFGVEIVGGENCSLLKHQLEQMFILLRILDVPKVWCEEVLLRESNNEISVRETEEWGDVVPEGWFDVCHECTWESVAKAWEIHQRILALQVEMDAVKEEVKERMRSGVTSIKRDTVDDEEENAIDYKIKKLLFPDLFSAATLPIYRDHHGDIKELPIPSSVSTSDIKIEDHERPSKAPVKRKMRRRMRRSTKILPKHNPETCATKMEADSDPNFSSDCEDIEDGDFNEKDSDSEKESENPNAQDKKEESVKEPYRRKYRKWKICRECDTRCKSEEDFASHRKAHEEVETEGKYVCTLCTFPARNAVEAKAHRRSRHKGPQKQLKPTKHYDCPKCPLRAERWLHLKEHVNEKHPSMTEEELVAAGLLLKCDPCKLEFEQIQRYTTHMIKVHPELMASKLGEDGAVQPIVCSDCGLKFATRKLLQNHQIVTHKRKSKFVCDECGAGFQWRSLFERHKEIHMDQSQKQQFICHLCGLNFFIVRQLKRHNKKCHSGNKYVPASTSSGAHSSEEVYKCKYCPLTSPIKLVIKRHLETHKEELGHRCDQCGKYYTSAGGLSRHIKINHGNETGQCPHCSKVFPSKEYVREHIKLYCGLSRLKGLGQNPAEMETGTGIATGELNPDLLHK